MRLLEPLALGSRVAPNRVIFGPHETNLARRRAVSDRHVAYYEARAAGGAGTIVIEEASVHASDWPYERCPLAPDSIPGWAAVAQACHRSGTVVLAALGHSGGQGSSAYSQAPLWAPSRVPEVNTREIPKWMEGADIAAVIAGFEEAARSAIGAGLDGVEINGGQHSLIRQFLSGLTNQRDDEWGDDRLLFATEVLGAARRGAGRDAVVGLRLSCDELAPWAGIVPEAAAALAASLAATGSIDYITVVRGAIFTVSATRPDGHVEPGFNLDLARRIRAAVPAGVAVIAQGSIVDVGQAEWAVSDGVADGVEMTRAQIAEPRLVSLAAHDHARIRPCILCNQACQVRDARNPILSCVVEPSAGHEATEPALGASGGGGQSLLVVGAGPAGLECARVAALRGFEVRVAFREERPGGMVRVAARGAGRGRLALAVDWLEAECERLGVTLLPGHEVDVDEVEARDGLIVLCSGSVAGHPTYAIDEGAVVHSAADLLAGASNQVGDAVAIWDPIGGPIGVSVAERLRADGVDVHLVTQDLIAGNELSRTGDLAPANVRLLQAGVVIEKRSILRRARAGAVDVEDRFTGQPRTIEVAALIDAGHRLPADGLWRATGGRLPRAGDAVAPRGIYEAILEGRRQALALAAALHPVGSTA